MKNFALILLACVSFLYSSNQSSRSCEFIYTITSSKLNVREQPNNKSQIMHVLNKGTQGCILSNQKEWVKIEEGWISKKFIKESKSNGQVSANKNKHNSFGDKLVALGILGAILIFIIYSLKGILISFRDRHYINIAAYFMALFYFLLASFFESNIYNMNYFFIIIPVLMFLSVRIFKLPVCDNCGNTKLYKTGQNMIDTRVNESHEGKKHLLKEYNSEYLCKRCGEYSNHLEIVKEDI